MTLLKPLFRFLAVAGTVFGLPGCADGTAPLFHQTPNAVLEPSGTRARMLDGAVGDAGSAWVLEDLGTLPGDILSIGSAINSQGDVAGMSGDGSGSARAVVWTGRTAIDLGRPNTWATGINDSGFVVGFLTTGRQGFQSFTWSKSAGIRILDHVSLFAVNNSGVAVGMAFTARRGWHAVSWSQDGGFRSLRPPGYRTSKATAISANGFITGWAIPVTNDTVHAALWLQNGQFVDLGPLPSEGSPLGINDSQTAVGYNFHAGGLPSPIIWRGDQRTEFTQLIGWATAVTNRGRIAGFLFDTLAHVNTAYTTFQSGPLQRLPIPGYLFSRAHAANECGSVAGSVGAITDHAARWRHLRCDPH